MPRFSALKGVIEAIANDCKEAKKTKEQPPIMNFDKLILSPDQVSESLFKSFLHTFYQGGVVFGAKLPFMFRGLESKELLYYLDEFRDESYLITIVGERVAATLRVGADDTESLKAFVHAMVIKKCLSIHSEGAATLPLRDIIQRLVVIPYLPAGVHHTPF